MFTYLWSDIYENLVVKSVGLNLFILLGSYSSGSEDASSNGNLHQKLMKYSNIFPSESCKERFIVSESPYRICSPPSLLFKW